MNFPALQVNNFFNDSDNIINFSKNQNYNYDKTGLYPGQRTDGLNNLDYNLFVYVTQKIMRLFYPDIEIFKKTLWEGISYFQKINYDDVKLHSEVGGKGWVHKDNNSMITAIIYLTPNDLNSGTSIYKLKKEGSNIDNEEQIIKRDYYQRKNIDEKTYCKYLKQSLNEHDEIIHFNSNFNSLVAFDSSLPHSANFNLKPGEERLTLITFLSNLTVPYFPVPEMRRI